MKYTLDEIAKILQSSDLNKTHEVTITGVAIDSRKVKKGDLFIPFVGENVDGHKFIETAFNNGAVATLCLDKNLNFDNNVIYVENSYLAIQQLAKDYLEKLNAITIAITGSNGKTTTKDIVASILSTKYKVHKTLGNLNNELGVPLTILSSDEDSEILVLEMGADGFNQLNFLSKLVEPDFAVITNIGESHIEFFKDRAGIARGKFEITEYLKDDGLFVYNGDEPLINDLVKNSSFTSISCGFSDKNQIYVKNYLLENEISYFELNNLNHKLHTKLKGKHNLLNIMYAYAIAKKLQISDDEFSNSLVHLEKITNMRLESIPFRNNSLIINDAYNASPTSMRAAIDVIEELKNYNKKYLVVGDMFELGKDEISFHCSIGNYFNATSTINEVISIGNLSQHITQNITNNNIITKHFSTNKEATTYLKGINFDNDVILFKASRGMKLESIVEELIK